MDTSVISNVNRVINQPEDERVPFQQPPEPMQVVANRIQEFAPLPQPLPQPIFMDEPQPPLPQPLFLPIAPPEPPPQTFQPPPPSPMQPVLLPNRRG